jgi:hypothetical protein
MQGYINQINSQQGLNGNNNSSAFVNSSPLINVTPDATGKYNFDYSSQSTFYVDTPPAQGNFNTNFINIPTTGNFVYYLIIMINTNNNNKSYINSLTVNGNASTLFIAGGANNVNISTSSFIIQKFTVTINSPGSQPFTLSEIISYS